MRLAHTGKTILVTLTKPEQAALAKAKGILEGIALVPCAEQADAVAALEALEALAGLVPADESEEEQ